MHRCLLQDTSPARQAPTPGYKRASRTLSQTSSRKSACQSAFCCSPKSRPVAVTAQVCALHNQRVTWCTRRQCCQTIRRSGRQPCSTATRSGSVRHWASSKQAEQWDMMVLAMGQLGHTLQTVQHQQMRGQICCRTLMQVSRLCNRVLL